MKCIYFSLAGHKNYPTYIQFIQKKLTNIVLFLCSYNTYYYIILMEKKIEYEICIISMLSYHVKNNVYPPRFFAKMNHNYYTLTENSCTHRRTCFCTLVVLVIWSANSIFIQPHTFLVCTPLVRISLHVNL